MFSPLNQTKRLAALSTSETQGTISTVPCRIDSAHARHQEGMPGRSIRRNVLSRILEEVLFRPNNASTRERVWPGHTEEEECAFNNTQGDALYSKQRKQWLWPGLEP